MARLNDRLGLQLGGESARARIRAVVTPAMRTLAEAGWLYVLYAAGSVLADKQRPAIGPIEMYLFVGAGLVLRLAGRRQPALGALLLIAGVVFAGVVGSLAGPQSRTFQGDWLREIGVHFAGWLAGVAVLRGAAVSIGEKAAEQLEGMLRAVPVLLGLIWAYTTFAGRAELWLPFAVAAMWGTGMYLSGSLVGIGLARLDVLHAEVTDERQRRAWRRLVLAIGFGVVPLAIPVAALAGIPLAVLLSPIVGPIQWLLSLLVYPLALILWVASILLEPVANWIVATLSGFQLNPRVVILPRAEDVARDASRDIATIAAVVISIATILVIAALVYMTARWLVTRRDIKNDLEPTTTADVERSIVLPEPETPVSAVRHRRRGPARDVVTAYLSALAALVGRPDARYPSETPADHAARVSRSAMPGASELRRLAAGYQLARYGERPITTRENVRALDRLRRLRRLLRASRA